jgi:tRNA(adenine34) deaminase
MKKFLFTLTVLFVLFQFSLAGDAPKKELAPDIIELEKKITAYIPDAQYPDDRFVLVTVQEALAGLKENNGGVGACLVRESTGEVVEQAHNRQFVPYFRSDLHAEMQLLTQYEERIKARRSDNPATPQAEQRQVDGLVLYTSMEPCPMCLARIINIRLKKVYYAAPDPSGGMAQKIQSLPTFWQELGAGSSFEPARCSPELSAIAKSLFRPMGRK